MRDAPGGVSLDVGALLALDSVRGVGPGVIRALVDRVGRPLDALAVASGAPELNRRTAKSLAELVGGEGAARIARAAADRADAALRRGDRLLGYGCPGYPRRLARLHYPPPLLWARGPLPADAPRTVAIVGTRRATRSARDTTCELAASLAEQGIRVVSGLARGIDAAAHRGALSARGETVAVLGSGLRFRYPRENHDLYDRLNDSGLLLTEFAPALRPEPHHFPRRNRIVAALSDAVLVVQAGERSGALLTAAHGTDIGIEVFACPGDVRLEVSAGCHGLLRDGAGLVTSARDVIDLLGWSEPTAAPPKAPIPEFRLGGEHGELERRLLDRLEAESASLDELVSMGVGTGSLAAVLTRLEVAGQVNGLPGGRYERAR